ncbi:MAG: 30S ribosomal protein S21 [Candidatus Nomurabacteria bacterium]|nr:MAG: 30S ribosomal protein S21 [Candidatus Nomurabacteria bacterium]
MVEVKKKDGESTESLLRRFTKRVQQSGLLIRAKKGRYYEAPRSKRAIRESAIRRKEIKDRNELLRKMGKLPELDRRKRKGGRPSGPRLPSVRT